MSALHFLAAVLLQGTSPDPQVAFMARLQSLCGKAFAGRMVSRDPADSAMAGSAMVMHVAKCTPTEIRIPFHVARADGSWDRSRTWVLTRLAGGLRLKHDHRHADGSADRLTLYGGATNATGRVARQDFEVDGESIALFTREGRYESVSNIWSLEVDPAKEPAARFAYQLRRTIPTERLFRVEFDLTKAVTPPPPPWGG